MMDLDPIFEAYDHWGLGPDVGGEWGRIRHENRSPLLEALAHHDRTLLDRVLTMPIERHGATTKLRDHGCLETDATEWTGLCSPCNASDIEAWSEITGQVPERLKAPAGALLPPDIFRHDAEAALLMRAGLYRLIDIGGGYGGMALQFFLHGAGRPLAYTDIDLFDTLCFAYAYLERRLPGQVRFGKDATSPIRLVPSHDAPRGPQAIDAVVNYRSWGEMSPATVAHYFRLIAEWRPPVVWHENATQISPGSLPSVLQDQADRQASYKRELLIHDYPDLPGYEVERSAPSPWKTGCRYMRVALRAT